MTAKAQSQHSPIMGQGIGRRAMQARHLASSGTLLALAACLFIDSPIQAQSRLAQNQPQSGEATFTSNADLVLVPVVVRAGQQQVSGLTKDDFAVLENGRSQKIAFARFTTAGTNLERAGGGNLFSNQVRSDGEVPRITIIALDAINTAYIDRAAARKQIVDYLAHNLDRRESTALIVFTLTGMQVIHDFTTNTNAVA